MPKKEYFTTDKIYVTYHAAKSLHKELENAFSQYGETNVSFEVELEYQFGQ